MGIGSDEANTTLQLVAPVIRSRSVSPPFFCGSQIRVGPAQDGQGRFFRKAFQRRPVADGHEFDEAHIDGKPAGQAGQRQNLVLRFFQ